MRFTETEVFGAFERYSRALEALGMEVPGHTLTYYSGSKVYGNPYRVNWVDDVSGGLSPTPGAPSNGSLGWSKREAYEALQRVASALEDVKYHQSQ